MKRPGFGLRAKLLLVTLSLTAIPAIGVGYVREMEALLREQQEQNLLAAARALAAALNDRPAVRRLKPQGARPTAEAAQPLAGAPLSSAAPDGKGAAGETRVPAEAKAVGEPGQAGAGAPAGDAQDVNRPAPTQPDSAGPHATDSPPARPALIATEDNAAPARTGEEVESIVTSFNRARARVWVVDRKRRLLALSGSLRAGAAAAPAEGGASAWERVEETVLRPLYSTLLKRPTEDFDDSLPENAISSGPEVERALTGIAGARWRATSDNRAVVVSAAHPVFAGDEVVAAVVVEETTNAIQTFTVRALEKLISATLAAFIVVAAIVLLFATRLANRVRRLRDEADSAIDARGRVRALTTASSSGDEIGDLSRSFSQLLERLARYHDYLENMGSRITHEFRTPVAVVRSSLDNLAMQPMPEEAREYMRRAEEGLTRLNKLITRMGEARRLEEALRDGERSVYDVREVVAGCVAGYRAAYPDHTFESRIPDLPGRVDGSPDLLAQALDKLVANAMGFALPGTPVMAGVRAEGGDIVIEVENRGPLLPDTPDDPARGRLFDSMVSLREGATDGEPHLGLGLYVVRLVAEFHRGRAWARNRDDGSGVVVGMSLPAARE